MAYPDELLVEGERVVLHHRPHGRLLVGPVLAFLLTSGVAGYLAALARGQGWAPWGWPAIAGVATLLVVWLAVAPMVRWRTTHLVVTTRRLLVREGVRRHQVIEVPFERIVAARARRGRWGRLLGHGSLLIDAGADGEVELVDVPRVERVRSLLERAAATAPVSR